ncbi:hypothetical protein Ahy_A10g047160 isoform B [Arachis hypogaea]|uniref:SWIM-type domain-containing protein n=1 Tax=Arachis hypogaea TaxID=3818 RepID=A0A445B1Q0_ARAHY|nr:hypothetical protein Ahy_A10g047160 isoform B [Arachis hypogaea]
MFEYESENLHTPISSDNEGRGNKFPKFDDDYAHGEGRFELGTRFTTVDRFKEVVKDLFIAERWESKWIKNDKERVRVSVIKSRRTIQNTLEGIWAITLLISTYRRCITSGMPCLHVLAAIRKRHDTPHDYLHP